MHEVFNMGCGFCVIVPEPDVEAALALLSGSLPRGQADRHASRTAPASSSAALAVV